MSGRVLSFDVESLGLHGRAWAVGWVYFEADGTEIESGCAACSPEDVYQHDIDDPSDLEWVKANCPQPERSCSTHAEVLAVFWRMWIRAREEGATLIADCAWPVEARFLASCVDCDPGRKWLGPYPLHDVATMRLAAGLDPLATVDRLPNEEPKHHPMADARQSGRLWFEAIRVFRDWRPTAEVTNV